jgi:hypothetical protein
MSAERRDFCKACGHEVPIEAVGTCPHCHADAGRRIELAAKEDIGIGLTEAGSLTKARTWREWRWSILILAVILTLASAMTGVGGPVGVAVGVVLGLIGTIIGFWASTSHKDTETTRF